jgi:A/G-specific adenine glycosylase
VGEYTASAVMAFACDDFSHVVLETNIRTVLIEHFYPRKKVVTDESLKELLSLLQEQKAVKSLGARHWYYALMDYGAHLKSKSISHNKKSSTYKKQTQYKGSHRELRAKTLFAITHGDVLPQDERIETVLNELIKEKFIKKTTSGYQLV